MGVREGGRGSARADKSFGAREVGGGGGDEGEDSVGIGVQGGGRISEGGGDMTILLDDLRSKKVVLTPEEIKALYRRICNREGGWLDVRALETVTGYDFKNTAQFHRKMADYFSRVVHGRTLRPISIGAQVRRKRSKLGLSQKQLAEELGVSQVQVVYYEKNESPATEKVLKWLNAK